MVALSIVCALEIFMLVYTLVNPPLFGQYIGTYRMGKMYRIGGDEFVALIHARKDALEARLGEYERRMAQWSEHNGLTLSAAYGCVCCGDHPSGITDIRRMADRKMYEAKALHYRESGRDRRRPGT